MANLLNSIPVLQISSAERSCEFYCDKLGFKKNWQYQHEPGMPWFVSIGRGPVTLFLTEYPESTAGALVYLYVQDVDRLFSEFRSRDVNIEKGPISQPWRVRELQLRDPDGNRLRFGQDMDTKTG